MALLVDGRPLGLGKNPGWLLGPPLLPRVPSSMLSASVVNSSTVGISSVNFGFASQAVSTPPWGLLAGALDGEVPLGEQSEHRRLRRLELSCFADHVVVAGVCEAGDGLPDEIADGDLLVMAISTAAQGHAYVQVDGLLGDRAWTAVLDGVLPVALRGLGRALATPSAT